MLLDGTKMRSEVDTPVSTFRREREFGIIVGGVLSLIGGLWLYLGKFGLLAQGKLILGGTLILAGLAFPRALVYPRKVWFAIAEFLFSLITKFALALVYFLVFAPAGFIMRLRGWDPLLRRSASAGSYWNDYSERQKDSRHYEKMY